MKGIGEALVLAFMLFEGSHYGKASCTSAISS